jgi:hypothetical protein
MVGDEGSLVPEALPLGGSNGTLEFDGGCSGWFTGTLVGEGGALVSPQALLPPPGRGFVGIVPGYGWGPG